MNERGGKVLMNEVRRKVRDVQTSEMKEMDMKDDEKTNLVRRKFWWENERVAMFQKTPKPRTTALLQFLSP